MAGIFGQGVDSSNSPFYAHNAPFLAFGIPAKQSGFAYPEQVLSQLSWRFHGADWRYGESYAAEVLSELVSRLGSMEMSGYNVIPQNINIIIFEELSDFEHGATFARQTARRLQNRVEEALAAGR